MEISNNMIFIFAFIIVLLILFLYKSSQSKLTKANNVLLFYRDGCPFCEIFKPEWAKIEKVLGERAKKFNTADPKSASLAFQYKVTGVPSIILIDKNGNHEKYSGTRDADNIISKFY